MKLTLLEMVQNILSSIEADEVNSIADTPEGQMIADIIKAVYFQMLTWASVPELRTAYFSLEGLSDTDYPTYLRLPSDVDELYWFKYDKQETDSTQKEYGNITYCEPQKFYEMLMGRDLALTEVIEVNSQDGVPLWIYNDRAPTYYTINEDNFIICDSYDADVDTTLQGSKTVAAGAKHPTFTISDSFTPDLDTNLFPYLLAEAKAIAMVELKQTNSSKHERVSREQKVRYQNEKHRFKELNTDNTTTQGPNYGRRRR